MARANSNGDLPSLLDLEMHLPNFGRRGRNGQSRGRVGNQNGQSRRGRDSSQGGQSHRGRDSSQGGQSRRGRDYSQDGQSRGSSQGGQSHRGRDSSQGGQSRRGRDFSQDGQSRRGRGSNLGDPRNAGGGCEVMRDNCLRNQPINRQRLKETVENLLADLLKKDDEDLACQLHLERRGLQDILKRVAKFDHAFPTFIEILVKVCRCQYFVNNMHATLQLLLTTDFPDILIKYLAVTPLQRNAAVNWIKFFDHLFIIFKKLIDVFPNKASEVLRPLIALSRNTIERTFKHLNFDQQFLDAVIEINNQVDENLSQFDRQTHQKLSEEEIKHAALPPDNFRVMPTVLCHADIYETPVPFLRSNIVKGSYRDVEHYLDVQFRLLREDFVAPLREGINEYLTFVSRNKTENIKLKDLKMYTNVQMAMLDKTPYNGIIHKLSFDVTKLKYVKWEMTKRFLHGSLMCLSADDFKSFKLAIIIKRDPKELAKGFVTVQLLGGRGWEFDSEQLFIMVESPTYFEAYQPILEGLKKLNEEMPFINTIVKAESEIKPPSYLSVVSEYDLKSIMSDQHSHHGQCRPLVPSTWPSEKDLNLDESQRNALQAALTRQIAIIQGPPGTGKTFLGLKIVEVLLKNEDSWSIDGHSPILVICYTNHALDQFLEGILKFLPHGIVRVGGQSKSEELKGLNINILKESMGTRRKVPELVFNLRHQTMNKIRAIAEEIDDIQTALQRAKVNILSEHLLFNSKILSETYLHQLESNAPHKGYKTAMKIWLSVDGISSKIRFKESVEENVQNPEVNASKDQNLSDEDMEDVLAEEEMANRIEDNEDWIMDEPDQILQNKYLELQDYLEDEVKAHVWKFSKKERKRRAQKMKWELKKADALTERQAESVENILFLSDNDRWRLYRYWLNKWKETKLTILTELQKEYDQNSKKLKEVTQMFDRDILRQATVIGMTTTGAAKHRETLQQVGPAIVIVEEAAEVLEAHIITALSKSCKHLILIGDQQQLRPSPTVYNLAKIFNLDVSLFERLINNELPYEKLVSQHRMRPEISSLLVPHIYPDLTDHVKVTKYENVNGMVKNVYFLDHRNAESAVTDSKSKSNEFEARMVVNLCRYLLLQGYAPERITILAAYLGQVFLIKSLMKGTLVKDVRCTVVDNFQGEENDIILLSLVRSNSEGSVGFLKIENRVCVALSRAKMGLYCVGNFPLLVKASPLWAQITKKLLDADSIGPTLLLVCQNHPQTSTEIKCVKDFENVPEGGCLEPCEYRLDCGHKCEKICHIIDKEHKLIKCLKPCPKILCALGHSCQKLCYKECGECIKLVEKMLPCNHLNMMPCYLDPSLYNCNAPCNKTLACGHGCRLKCSDVCTVTKCIIPIDILSPCGHNVMIPCNLSKDSNALLKACQKPCETVLSCEHRCKGTCFNCKQKRIHIECKEMCGRTLVCGHNCNIPCAENCPPCKRKCENRCIHSKCPKKCGEPCKSCMEPCVWKCRHQACNKLCHEFCDRTPCPEPCPKELQKCGHACIGHCGEPCPPKCRICDREEVCEIFFGREDDEDSKFVWLEDCGHVIESSGMDQWMTIEDTGSEIVMKKCPKCKTVIRKNLRYGNVVKRMWNGVIGVKQKVMKEHKQLQREILKAKIKATTNLKTFAMFSYASQQIRDKISRNNLNTYDVNLLNNKINFLSKMSQIWRHGASSVRFHVVEGSLTELEDILVKMENKSAIETLKDFTQEIRRVEYLNNVIVAVERKLLNEKARECFEELQSVLTSKQKFTIEREEYVKMLIEKLNQRQTGLGISNAEKMEILSAMNLGKGHWFKCPNGHIYAIGECGGAMQRGKCPECGRDIGGQSHQLTGGNTLATEMDGASQPAYPTFLRL